MYKGHSPEAPQNGLQCCRDAHLSALTLTSDATVESSKMARIEWSTQDCVSISTPSTSSHRLRTICRHTNIILNPCVNLHARWFLPPEMLQHTSSSGCDQKLRNRTQQARNELSQHKEEEELPVLTMLQILLWKNSGTELMCNPCLLSYEPNKCTDRETSLCRLEWHVKNTR